MVPVRSGLAVVTLAMRLVGVKATLVDQLGITKRTANTFRPAHLTHFLVAFLLVNQVVKMEEHAPILPAYFSLRDLLEIGKEP
jgi:hypothetical protein